MRVALLALLLAAIGLALFLVDRVPVDPGGEGSGDRPVVEETLPPEPAAPDDEAARVTPDETARAGAELPVRDMTPPSEREPIPLADLDPEKMRPFEGFVLMRQEDGPARTVRAGYFDLEIVRFGHRYPQRVDLENGRFAVEVPDDARVSLGAGRFDGTIAHFEKPAGLFDPPSVEYGLEATPTNLVTLVVRDGPSGAPLGEVRVERGATAKSARIGEARDTGREPLVASSPSPVLLPHLRAEGPVWLRISAPGYATTSELVDPRRSAEREVLLWPAADLDVQVTGPGRAKLKSLVLTRSLPRGETMHVGTFSRTEGSEEPDGLHFAVRGLAARTHTLSAKGFDKLGRMRELGKATVELGAGELGSVQLYLP
ncbi:MAG: hypothetical protein AAFU73_06090 [Planctomycetota bacterium]